MAIAGCTTLKTVTVSLGGTQSHSALIHRTDLHNLDMRKDGKRGHVLCHVSELATTYIFSCIGHFTFDQLS